MADVPAGTLVFTGPGEAKDSQFMYLFVRGSTDRALEGKPALSEWQFTADPAGAFTGDAARGLESLQKLQSFVTSHPEIEVRLGHQH